MTSTVGSLFADFFLATGPTTATSEQDIVNEIQKRTYFTRFLMGGGDDFSDFFQGGDRIQDDILLDSDSTYEHYDPDDEFTYRSSEVLSQWTVNWRFTKIHLKFTDHEIELNGGGPGSTGPQLHDRFKDLMRSKKQNFWTNACNGLEDDWWAQPSNTGMESDSGQLPYSLPCFVNEYLTTDAITITQNGVPNGFTTIQGINPATKGRWDNFRTTYAALPAPTLAGGWDGWQAFRRCRLKTEFHRMPKRADLGEGHTYPGMILCSEEGLILLEKALQFANDPLAAASSGKGDPTIDDLRYKGADIVHFQGMTEGNFFTDEAGGVTTYTPEIAGTTDANGALISAQPNVTEPTQRDGPRFVFADNRYLRVFFKRGRMFKTAKIRPERQPWSTVVVADLWHNNYCRSRQRLAMVSPTGALLGAA